MVISGAAVVLSEDCTACSSWWWAASSHMDTITSLQADFTVRCSFIIYLFNVVSTNQVTETWSEFFCFGAVSQLQQLW